MRLISTDDGGWCDRIRFDEITEYEWEVAGQSFDGESLEPVFGSPENQSVRVTGTNRAGETATITRVIQVTREERATEMFNPDRLAVTTERQDVTLGGESPEVTARGQLGQADARPDSKS